MPNQKDMFASQKSLFAVRTGTPMWSQTVAIPSSAKRCTFSICTIAVRGIQKLYVQTKDPDTGVAYNAVCIGDWLGTTRPQCMVDGKANVHVFFPTTPMLGAYSRINYRGTMEKLQYYKKVMGTPSMVFLPDGSVRVTGAVHYDPTVQPKTVPDAADVPGMYPPGVAGCCAGGKTRKMDAGPFPAPERSGRRFRNPPAASFPAAARFSGCAARSPAPR